MAQVKLSWSRKTVPEKLIKGDYIVQLMTDNVAIYATPNPALADVTAAIINLRKSAIDAEAGGYALTFSKNQAEIALDHLISQLMSYVQNASDGNADNILLSGMEIRKAAQPTPDPTQVMNLDAFPSRTQGHIDLNWDTLGDRYIYQVERWVDGEDESDTGFWDKVATPSKSKYTATGLETGKVYRFRVAGIGSNDRLGPYNQDATSVAP